MSFGTLFYNFSYQVLKEFIYLMFERKCSKDAARHNMEQSKLFVFTDITL